jgi:dolichol-phosphate mannosyltransferase
MSALPTAQPRPLVSIVFSFRNEEEVIPELVQRLQAVAARLPVDCEFIFVNDASTDRSLQLLAERASEDRRIKVITLSRRFGVMEGFLAAMKHARGDAVITMDCDLQDPPEVIPELVDKWQAGATVVYTVRTDREGESALKILLTRLAYRAIRLVANEKMPVEAGDFKLIGRRVVDELLKLNETDPYLRGLVTWMGFKQSPVYYKRAARSKGTTHFPLFRSKGPIVTFVFGFTSFSVLPLAVFLVLGLALTLLSALSAAVLCAMKLLALTTPPWGWLIATLGFFSGLQLTGIGTLGLYLGRVYNDVRNRPRYLVASTIGFEEQP